MSKIGKKPIEIPAGVEIKIDNQNVVVKGPKGELQQILPLGVKVVVEDNQIITSLLDEEKKNLWGLSRTLVSNMVEGVTNGYQKKLLVIGVGYAAKKEGNGILLSLGLSHKVTFPIPQGITFDVEQDQKGNYVITLNGINKQYLGEIAANLRALRKPEPYKGKGIRYFDEVVKLKAGKTAKK